MINVFASCLLVAYFLFVTSKIFYFKKKINEISLSEKLIYGIIIISFISLGINFFTPLSPKLNTLIFVIIVLIAIVQKKAIITKQELILLLVISLLSTLFLLFSNTNRPDSGLYHYPYIKIINDEKIIFGLINLHPRFALISILQYQSAFFNNFILNLNGIVIPSAIIASATIILICEEIFLSIKKKKIHINDIFLLFLLIFISFQMSNYSKFGNDGPAHFLLFFLTIIFIKNFKNKEKFGEIFLLSIFVLLNKISLLVAILIPISHFFLNKLNFFKILNIKIIIGLALLTLWLLKNVIISSCLLFPIKNTCLENLSWSNPSKVVSYSIGIEAYAKGLPDQKEDNYLPGEVYYKNFNWFKTWIHGHFKKKILPGLGIYTLVLIIVFFLFYLKNKNQTKKKIIYKKYDYLQPYRIILYLSSFGSLIWFLKFPVYRLGYSTLALFIISLSIFIQKKFINENKFNFNLNYFKALFILSIIVILSKQLLRIEKNFNQNYFNYPWVKFFGSNAINSPTKNQPVKYKGKIIYRIPFEDSDQLCYFSKSICVPPHEVEKRLKFIENKTYKFYIKTKFY